MDDFPGAAVGNEKFIRTWTGLTLHAVEHSGETVIVVLRPAFIRMVVTLGANEPTTEKNLRGSFECVICVLSGAIIIGWRMNEGAATGRE